MEHESSTFTPEPNAVMKCTTRTLCLAKNLLPETEQKVKTIPPLRRSFFQCSQIKLLSHCMDPFINRFFVQFKSCKFNAAFPYEYLTYPFINRLSLISYIEGTNEKEAKIAALIGKLLDL